MADPFDPPSLEAARAASEGVPKATGPEVGILESIGLGYQRGGVQEDWGLNQVNHEGRAVQRLYDELAKRGHKLEREGLDQFRVASRLADGQDSSPGAYREQIANVRAFWRALAAERAKDPAFLPDMADVGDYASLLKHVAARRNEEIERIDTRLQGGSGIGMFIGQIGHGMTDPTSFVPGAGQGAAGLSVARQILGTAAREAAANVAVTAVIEPLVRRDAASLGRERGADEFLLDVGVSAVAGAAIGGTVKGVELGVPAAVDRLTSLERKIARSIAAAEPEAGAFMSAVPPGFRTPDETAALNVAARAAEVREASPFVPSPTGDQANADLLDGWLDRIMAGGERVPRPPLPPVARADVAAGNGAGLRAPAREQLKARIRQAESSGDDRAANPRSSARGRYQFTRGTWLSYYKRRYGRGLADDAIWEKRYDPALQEVLMDDLTADNARMLKAADLPETAGSLYLLHFAGPDGVRVLKSAPDRPLAAILSPEAMAANPFLQGRNAGWLVAWADRKMGAPGETPTGTGAADGAPIEAIPDRGEPPEISLFEREADAGGLGLDSPALRPELFDSPEAHARAQLAFERERDAAEGFTWIKDDAPEFFDPWDRLDDLKSYAKGKGSLKPEKIAEALGITPAQARQLAVALTSTAGSPIRLRRDGSYARVPKMPDKPQSLLEFVAERGGVDDVGGDLRSMDAHLWHREAPFRKRLLRERSAEAEPGLAESPAHGLDAHFAAAIEAGYFPELAHLRGSDFGYGELPDLQIMRDAIDAELRGKPLYTQEDADADIERIRELDPQEADAIEAIAERAKALGVELDAITADDALGWMARGYNEAEAVDMAINAASFRDLADFETVDPTYGMSDDGRRWEDEINHDGDPGASSEDDWTDGAGGRGPEPDGADAAAGRAEFAELEGDAGAGSGADASLTFDAPTGAGAKLQSDSLEHDLRMALRLQAALQDVPEPDTAAAMVAEFDKHIDAADQAVLAEQYGRPTFDEEARSRFADDIILAIDKGLDAVGEAVRAIIAKVQKGVMAALVVLNPGQLQAIDLPTHGLAPRVVIEQRATLPAGVEGISAAARSTYEAMAPVATRAGRGFFIADKPGGAIHVFGRDGRHIASASALYGKMKGDAYVAPLKGGAGAALDKTQPITPAGRYEVRFENSSYKGGKIGRLFRPGSDDPMGVNGVAIHSVYLGRPQDNRLGRLATAGAADNKISYGCINTSEQAFVGAIVPNIAELDGGMIFTLPENPADAAAMFPAERIEAPGAPSEPARSPSRPDSGLAAREEDALAFRLEEDGDPVAVAAVLDEIDQGGAAIETMRACMVPAKAEP